MTFKEMFLARRVASKSKQNMGSKADDWSNQDEDERLDSFDESRDELNPLERFFSDAASVLSGAATEVASVTGPVLSGAATEVANVVEDVNSIIAADAELDAEKELKKSLSKSNEEREEWKKVKGSPSTLAKELKKLDKLERKVEKAEKQIMKNIMKTEKQIDKAEEEQTKARLKIKALSHKFELQSMMQDDDDDDDDNDEMADERVREVLKDGAGGLAVAGEGAVSYVPRLVTSVNRTATKKIFPVDGVVNERQD
eukprot:CAMPEP_0113404740 /NCGR_PEP_ID=MMETSP0013_2-20120614/18563_1 /TAXON_ID=2843 ORGANISM="Skeletonema costatum, Strain 1716" /NCGR_SAMPLE_ID=MMETSP0013_2 /ASSEMBLY_ACC=CAM_ASM_000158 /LENGTH=255 /DNA_ID=CAMNT_0000290387 /DNA_START=59 /DNA_END=826 /DNA_ORIENTATION=+ /assembly_acc=CAM_ASM_000158